MTTVGYSSIQKGLHWALFALVVGIYLLTFGDDLFQRGDPNRALAWWLHISLGLLLAALVLWRLALRLARGAPALPNSMTGSERTVAKLGHFALYVLLIAIPVLGILLTWFRGDALTFFGLFAIPAPFTPDRGIAGGIREIHSLCANAILILAGGHAAAALWHHFVRRDEVLERMLPRREA